MVESKMQVLADEFNKKYWAACSASDATLFYEASLLARQLIFELGKNGVINDKLLDCAYPNKLTLEKV